MNEDTLLPFDLPSVARKKSTVGFDGGQLSSDAGVLLLRGAEKRIGICARLAACLRDRRNPESIEHPLEEMIKLRTFAIAQTYPTRPITMVVPFAAGQDDSPAAG